MTISSENPRQQTGQESNGCWLNMGPIGVLKEGFWKYYSTFGMGRCTPKRAASSGSARLNV